MFPVINRSRWRRYAEVLAVWGIAIVQPLLGVLGSAPDYFITFHVPAARVSWFVIGLVLVVPTAAILVELVVWRLVRVRELFHYSVIGSCLTIAIAQIWKNSLGIAGVPYVALTLVASTLVVAAYVKWNAMREWLAWIAVVPILASALFFLSTPSGRYARADANGPEKGSSIDAPVVMLMFDEFPLTSLLDGRGGIDAVRYPNFARLASLSTWYRNYSTTAEVTQFAIPSMLSGIKPKRGLAGTAADHPKTLFSLVAGNHRMNVSEVVTQLCPSSICGTSEVVSSPADWTGFLRGLRVVMRQRIDTTKNNEMNIFEGFAANTGTTGTITGTATGSGGEIPFSELPTTSVQNFIAAVQTNRFDTWLNSLTGEGGLSFNFLHLLLPHQPWVYLPDATMYGTTEEEYISTETAWETKVKEQRHLLQVQYVDNLIGELLDKLEAEQLLEKSLIVVAADHGASFRSEYHRRYATSDLANATDLMHTPLFVRYPNQSSGEVVDDNVENIDVLAILARNLGFTVPWKMDGMLPEAKTGARAVTKTLYFTSDPYGAPKRDVDRVSIDFDVFRRETLTAGFTSSAEKSGAVDFLYRMTPFDTLRGRPLVSFVQRNGSLRFTIDPDVAKDSRRILVRGNLAGTASADSWFALVVDDRIAGLSPLVRRDGKQRLVSFVYPGAKSAEYSVFRIIDDSTLERVIISP